MLYQISNGAVAFGDDVILHSIDFEIRNTEKIAIVGRNGCGKTTLARTILGMMHDYTGEVIHYSKRPQMVFQDPFSSLNPARTVGWILEEPLRAAGVMTAAQRRQRFVLPLSFVSVSMMAFPPLCQPQQCRAAADTGQDHRRDARISGGR